MARFLLEHGTDANALDVNIYASTVRRRCTDRGLVTEAWEILQGRPPLSYVP